MAKTRKTGRAGRDLIKKYEGLRLEAYRCPAGVWTIGYGHIRTTTPDMKITAAKANLLLIEDLATAEKAVSRLVKVELNQSQFDALVSFVFNVGVGAFERSTLLRLLNAGEYDDVPAQLARWNKVKGKVTRGLVRRREDEAKLFMAEDLPDEEPMPQAVDKPEKALSTDKTIWGTITSVAGAGGLGFLSSVDSAWAFAAFSVVAIGVLLFATGRLELRKAGA